MVKGRPLTLKRRTLATLIASEEMRVFNASKRGSGPHQIDCRDLDARSKPVGVQIHTALAGFKIKIHLPHDAPATSPERWVGP
jgi:hypothetical protein